MAAKVLCMASAKGGSGKTVLTATFCTFLVALGKKVLAVDTDAATNGLSLLYLKEVMTEAEMVIGETRRPKGVYELNPNSCVPDIVKLPNGLHLIPATYEFQNTEKCNFEVYKFCLYELVSSMRESYDYIFLDAQAGSDAFAHVAMTKKASDEVIIVSEYDPMSAAGVERLKGIFREDLTYGRTWVLLNKMLPEFVKSFSDFLEVAKYLSPIPWDSDVVRAYARRRLALELDNVNEFTIAIMRTLEGLFRDEISSEIAKWAESRQSAIRAPIDQRYQDAENEMKGLLKDLANKENLVFEERRRNQLKKSTIALVVVAVIVGGTYQYYRSHSEIASILDTTSTIFAGFVAVIASFYYINFAYDRFSSLYLSKKEDYNFERRTLEMKVAEVDGRLRKLSALRQADLKTLIKHKE